MNSLAAALLLLPVLSQGAMQPAGGIGSPKDAPLPASLSVPDNWTCSAGKAGNSPLEATITCKTSEVGSEITVGRWVGPYAPASLGEYADRLTDRRDILRQESLTLSNWPALQVVRRGGFWMYPPGAPGPSIQFVSDLVLVENEGPLLSCSLRSQEQTYEGVRESFLQFCSSVAEAQLADKVKH